MQNPYRFYVWNSEDKRVDVLTTSDFNIIRAMNKKIKNSRITAIAYEYRDSSWVFIGNLDYNYVNKKQITEYMEVYPVKILAS